MDRRKIAGLHRKIEKIIEKRNKEEKEREKKKQ